MKTMRRCSAITKFVSNAFNSFLAYFRNVSIPGIKTISDNDQPIFLKLIWLTVITLCFYLCINQLSGRIEYYYSYPVTLSYELRPVGRLNFPIITLCLEPQSSAWNPRPWSPPANPKTFSDVIDTCRYSGSKLCNSSAYWFPKITAAGTCYSLIIPDSYYYFGPSSGVTFTLKDKSGSQPDHKWTVIINREWDDAIYHSLDKGFPIFNTLISTISYTEKLFIHENVSVRPCFPDDVARHCRLSCKDQMFLNDKDCKLAFMTTVDLPICNSSSRLNVKDVWQKNDTPCLCDKPCVSNTYELQMDTREEIQFNSTVVNVFSNREEVEVLAEKRAFVLYALICEIGGTLGLFLGACLLTFIEIFECVAAGLCRKSKETKVKPLERKPPFLIYTINVPSKQNYFTHFRP